MKLLRHEPSRIEIRVLEAPAGGVLVISDPIAPGWDAAITAVAAEEGLPSRRAVEVLRADHALRAVPIPAGSWRVELRYRPPGLAAGILLGAAGAAALLVLVWLAPLIVGSSDRS